MMLKLWSLPEIAPVRTESKIRDRHGDDRISLVYDDPGLHYVSISILVISDLLYPQLVKYFCLHLKRVNEFSWPEEKSTV